VICAHLYTHEEKMVLQRKPRSEQFELSHMRLQTSKKRWAGALPSGKGCFCVKTIVKELRKSELAHLNSKKQKKKREKQKSGSILSQF